MKEYAFGIDLGGTTAKVGLFTTSGALLEKWEVPTDTSNAGEHILENLADAIHAKMAEKEITSEQVEGVGIGVPGPVLDSRVVPIICANLGGWGERNVSAQLSGLLDGMKVLVGNDANVAALGEIWMGTAKGCRSAVMVTLGTGVGGGVIVNGKVIDGAHGAGGEIGHITVNRHETATCGCGKHGCLEQYSSATGVVRCMKKLLDENPDADCVLRGKDFEAKDVFDAARSGDALAAREVDELQELAPSVNADPDKVLCVKTDVTKEDDCRNLIECTVRKYGRIDILVNNAGISMRAMFKDLDLSVIRSLMDVNFWGTVQCTKFALPYLLQSKGQVVGVISIAGFSALPARTGYSASKYAIRGFLDTIRIEHLKDGLNVLVFAPGYTDSNVRKAALTADGSPQGETPLKEDKLMSAEKCAEYLAKGLEKRKSQMILTGLGKVTVLAHRLFPRLTDKLTYGFIAKEAGSPFK